MKDLSIPRGFESLFATAAVWGMRVLGVLVTLCFAWVVAGWARRAIIRSSEKRDLDLTLSRFFANMARYAILTGAVVGCLGIFGIETSSFAALIAAMGLAIGLAFQGTLSNFAAGAMLLVFRPFKVGDMIRAGGELGTVREIELFTTELTTPDNRCIIIPNSKIFGDTIENISTYPTRRVEVLVGTAYSAGTQQTRDVLLRAATAVEGVLADPAPAAFMAELGGSSVNWKVRVWCQTENYWPVFERTTEAVKTALDAAKISIPFPQLDVHLDR